MARKASVFGRSENNFTVFPGRTTRSRQGIEAKGRDSPGHRGKRTGIVAADDSRRQDPNEGLFQEATTLEGVPYVAVARIVAVQAVFTP